MGNDRHLFALFSFPLSTENKSKYDETWGCCGRSTDVRQAILYQRV